MFQSGDDPTIILPLGLTLSLHSVIDQNRVQKVHEKSLNLSEGWSGVELVPPAHLHDMPDARGTFTWGLQRFSIKDVLTVFPIRFICGKSRDR